jgi:DNA-binding GntR family transcriptional regulator
MPAAERRHGDGNLADRVFEAVKRDIVENRLHADEILAEGALAERFEVSRAPAREALQRLAAVGFVRAVPRVGYIVTSVRVRDFDEIFQMRIALEPLATELATERLSDQTATHLDELAAQVADVVDAPPPERATLLVQVNATFHRAVASASGNARLAHAISALIDELERVMHMLADDPSLRAVRDQHPALVRTMKAGDPAAAGALMREHLLHDYELMRDLAIRGEAGVLRQVAR